jgi:predicted DNA-binding transcriptional regulator AlpA
VDGINKVPSLMALVNDQAKIALLPPEVIPVIRGELARIDTLLLMRLSMAYLTGAGERCAEGDRLLDVNEAARKLGKSTDFLYRHATKYPFTVRDGRSLRFSEQGIEKFIRQRMAR